MRDDVRPGIVILAVAKALEAYCDRAEWIELGLLTDTQGDIEDHPRLLRSLAWGDDDYFGCVLDIVPTVLGERRTKDGQTVFKNLQTVEDFVKLPEWLEKNDPGRHAELYGGGAALRSAVSDLEDTAKQLGLSDVDEHIARIRRGLIEDAPLAIGSAKELLETVFKTILGLHGTGKETKLDLPDLAKKVNVALGLDDQGTRGEEPGAKQRRGVLKGLNSIISGIGEIRNEGFGTGHGIYGRPELDLATAQLVVSAAAAAATFYMEAHITSRDRA